MLEKATKATEAMIAIIQNLELAKTGIEVLRSISVQDAVESGIDGRALSIAITHLETAHSKNPSEGRNIL